MTTPDQHEVAVRAAAEANYERSRVVMQHLNQHVHIEFWRELPEDERDIEIGNVTLAINAYTNALSEADSIDGAEREQLETDEELSLRISQPDNSPPIPIPDD